MKISFIGAGNVAWHMAQAFEKANHSVVEIYSRDRKNARKLCDKLYNAQVIDNLGFKASKAELIVIAVPDDAIETVVSQLQLPEKMMVVHTSGTKNLDALAPLTQAKTGVFYPLQTFTKAKAINFKPIPICIEAQDTATEKILQKLAFTICENVGIVNSNDRLILHLAAVFACNFSNHLMTISKKILENEGLDFAILKPLIQETIEKALAKGPENSQTGPAARNDVRTMQKQMSLLDKTPLWKTIYGNITDSIIQSEYSK